VDSQRGLQNFEVWTIDHSGTFGFILLRFDKNNDMWCRC
jgi:hypothetical protein